MSGNNKGSPKKSVNYFLFAFGDFGYQCVFFWVSAFLMIFYTDVFLIPVGAVSALMLVTRLFDAFNDPVIGGMQDRSKSKFGRYRPSVIVGGIGLGISVIFLFWAHPDMSEGGKIAYMYITYIIVVIFSTIFYMAYGALNGVITEKPMERAKFSSSRFVATNLAALIISLVSASALAHFSDQAHGYLICLIVCACVGVPMMVIAGLSNKEVIGRKEDQKPINMKTQFRAFFRNKALIIIVLNMLFYGFQFNIRMTSATYFFTYNVGNFAMFSIYSALSSLLGMLGAFCAPKFYARIKNKARVASYFMFATAAFYIVQFFLPTSGSFIYGHLVISALAGFSLGVYPSMIYGMLPDATDQVELNEDIRIDGFCSSIASFGFKAGGAIAVSIIGVLLAFGGFVANQAQPGTALTMIRITMCAIPALMSVIAGISLLFYKIDDEAHAKIRAALHEKNYQ